MNPSATPTEPAEALHALLDWDRDPERCWLVTAKLATALTALERPEEAGVLYDDACASSALPSIHMQAAYGRAMLLTRFNDDAGRDHKQAKAWINTAIAIAGLFPDAERRTFNVTFNENGLALIEMHLGDLDESLRLVTDGLTRLDREVGPDVQTLHRSVLRYNRALLLGRLGAIEDAIDSDVAATLTRQLDDSTEQFQARLATAQLRRKQEELGDILPPPKYTSADFLNATCWRLRGPLA